MLKHTIPVTEWRTKMLPNVAALYTSEYRVRDDRMNEQREEKNGEGEQTNEIQFHFIGILSSLYLTVKYIRNSAWRAHRTLNIWHRMNARWIAPQHRRSPSTSTMTHTAKNTHTHSSYTTQNTYTKKRVVNSRYTSVPHLSSTPLAYPQKSYLQFKDKRIYFVDRREYTSGLHHWET